MTVSLSTHHSLVCVSPSVYWLMNGFEKDGLCQMVGTDSLRHLEFPEGQEFHARSIRYRMSQRDDRFV
jgi:hypothetical protein